MDIPLYSLPYDEAYSGRRGKSVKNIPAHINAPYSARPVIKNNFLYKHLLKLRLCNNQINPKCLQPPYTLTKTPLLFKHILQINSIILKSLYTLRSIPLIPSKRKKCETGILLCYAGNHA